MTDPMLQSALPRLLAEHGEVIEKKGKIEDFPRLAEIIEADLGSLQTGPMPAEWRHAAVDIRLRFGWTDAVPGVPALEGRLTADIVAVCQRCLEPFELRLNADLKLLLPEADASTLACDGYEVWEFDGAEVRPLDIVEEALVMAMPFSALHELSENCVPDMQETNKVDSESVRPFADLKNLMTQSDVDN